MKFLCVCWAGHSRSVTLTRAFHLWGHNAVAIGLCSSGPDLMNVLCEWADVVCPLQGYFIDGIPKEFHKKVTKHFDIGEDIWGVPYTPAMQKIIDDRIYSYLIENKIPHLTPLYRAQDPAPLTPEALNRKQSLVTTGRR